LNDNEKKVIKYLTINKKIISDDVEKLLNIKEAMARRILSNMAKKGILEKIGKTKGSYYILKEKNAR
jgi:ATP-dependent DNA helicase RecG